MAQAQGQLMPALMRFLFPANLEHPESTGRMDVFAWYGPVDDEGNLRSGPQGKHVMTNLEVRQMIAEINREQLYSLIARPRETVETVVNELLPKSLAHHYTEAEVEKLFSGISQTQDGRAKFAELQKVVMDDQRRRLVTLLGGGQITRAKRAPIPYQTKSAQVLRKMTTKSKLLPCQEFMATIKRMHANCTLIAPIEQQNLSGQLASNVLLVRDLGLPNDRWDRYCGIRQTGKSSYVQARNVPRADVLGDGLLPTKSPYVSSMNSTLAMNGPRTAPKVSELPSR
jgi:hypothetical protein